MLDYSARIDKADLTAETVRVPREELAKAHAEADPQLLQSIRRVRENIRAFQEAILHYEKALLAGQEQSAIRANLARALVESGRFEEAVAQYREVVSQNPHLPNERVYLGVALTGLGRLTEVSLLEDQISRIRDYISQLKMIVGARDMVRVRRVGQAYEPERLDTRVQVLVTPIAGAVPMVFGLVLLLVRAVRDPRAA